MKIALALAVLSLLSGCIESASEDKNAPFYTYDATSFSCDGKSLKTACGPAYWHTLTGYEACGGMKQSPVNIETASAEIAVGVPQFDAEAGCSEWDQYANDHAFQVDFAKCDSLGVTYEGTYYTLLQFHFHSPSVSTLIHSYYHSYYHSYTHTLIHSYTHTLIHSYTHTLLHAYTHTLIHSYTHTLIHSYTHTLIHSYSHTGGPASTQHMLHHC